MTTVKMPIAVASTFLWIGFVCAISFMEAWLKFKAPGITVPLGLGIGRLVFHALNNVELILALVILVNITFSGNGIFTVKNLWYFIPLMLLIIQTLYLLPALDARAEQHLQGQPVPHSSLHFYYIAFELVKVTCLVVYSKTLFVNHHT